MFSQYIGIDYSGEGDPMERLDGLKVYCAKSGCTPQPVHANNGGTRWSRAALATWLEGVLADPGVIVGIDHAFSFPQVYLNMFCFTKWDAFLRHFCATYDTTRRPVDDYLHTPHRVKQLRGLPCGIDPIATLRITERRSGTAFSVFDFRPRGVAYSTFAGIPWLQTLRQRLGARVHWWPYDGWTPPSGCSVVVEAYATICRARVTMPDQKWSDHQRDAYAIAAWLEERDQNGLLASYYTPPLTHDERQTADVEGWILGVS